jgi:hypothetical protein
MEFSLVSLSDSLSWRLPGETKENHKNVGGLLAKI